MLISANFQMRHPRLAALIRACSQRPGSKWTVLEDIALFNQAFKTAQKNKKGGQVMVLCGKSETTAPLPGISTNIKRVAFHKFQKSIHRPDEEHTVSSI